MTRKHRPQYDPAVKITDRHDALLAYMGLMALSETEPGQTGLWQLLPDDWRQRLDRLLRQAAIDWATDGTRHDDP